MFGKGDRCDIGKSCGSTCITRLKVCRVDFGDNISKSIDRISGSIDASFIDDAKESLEDYLARVEPNTKEKFPIKKKLSEPKKVVSGGTEWERLNAEDFDKQFEKDGVGERIAGTRKNFNWSHSIENGIKIGEGTFGTAILVDGNPGYVVKRGQVSTTESKITGIMGKAGLGPKLIYGENSSQPAIVDGGVFILNGRIAMSRVPGKDYNNFEAASDRVGKSTVGDSYWALRSQTHKLGVAHNDAYAGNVLIDKSGKSRFVDMGLSQNNPKAALSEALGVFTGKKFLPKGSTLDMSKDNASSLGDYNARFPQTGFVKGRIAKDAPKNLQKMVGNLPKVYDALRSHGISDNEITRMIITQVRQPLPSYEKGPWAKLSNKDAAKVIDILYDGVKDYSKD